MTFGVAFFIGKKIHLDIFPEDVKWINTSNMTFSLLTTVWTLYGVLNFHALLSIIPIWRASFPLGLAILLSPYLILYAILRIIEQNT